MKQGSTALASLRPQEAVQVLARLMDSHPELVAEMENLAAKAIARRAGTRLMRLFPSGCAGWASTIWRSSPECTEGGMCSRGRRPES